ncbi:tubulin-like doman-containing protein [Streptomyces sp. F63]|uniref:tubulin-like doman-containing protein n=1 Tax=Streptomyces sp. F63 TaxID=2824887 RepID=UPI001FFDB58F|nr:tubulin-like doman-containing protein [Streptomyces sp. F63]
MKIYQPMLFVGLGGTGGRIGAELERGLRRELCGPDGTRLVADGRRAPFQLPDCLQFVYADFSESELDQLPHLSAKGTEAAAYTRTSRAVHDLLPAGYDTSPEVTRMLRVALHEETRSWLPPEARQPRVAPLHNGAGQLPTVGRAALFATLRSGLEPVLRQLRAAVGAIGNSAGDLREMGGRQIRGCDVFVAFSVAGGTGAGIFYDFIHLIGHEFGRSKVPGVKIYPLVVMPSAFTPEAGGGREAELNSARALVDLSRLVDHQNVPDAQADFGDVEPPAEAGVRYPVEGMVKLRSSTVQTAFLFSRPSVIRPEDLRRSITAMVMSLIGTELGDENSQGRTEGDYQSFAASFVNKSVERSTPSHSGIGYRGMSTSLAASLTVPVDDLAEIVAGRLLAQAVRGMAEDARRPRDDDAELVRDMFLRSGIDRLWSREAPGIPAPDPLPKGGKPIAQALRDRIGDMEDGLARLDRELDRDISRLVDDFKPGTGARELLGRLGPFRLERILTGLPGHPRRTAEAGFTGMLENRKNDPERPEGVGVSAPLIPRIKGGVGGLVPARWGDPDVQEAIDEQDAWYRWRGNRQWHRAWKEHESRWRPPLVRALKETGELVRALRAHEEDERKLFAERRKELYRDDRTGVSYLLPPQNNLRAFYDDVFDRLVRHGGLPENPDPATLLARLVRPEDWQRALDAVRRSPRAAVKEIKQVLERRVKSLFGETSDLDDRPLLPSLGVLLRAAAGDEDAAAAVDGRWLEQFRSQLAGLLPVGFTPDGSGPLQALIVHPRSEADQRAGEYLKQELNLPRDTVGEPECRAVEAEAITVVLFRSGMSLTDVSEVRHSLRLWAEARDAAGGGDFLHWRQRLGYRDDWLASTEDDRRRILHRILCAVWNGQVDVQGDPASPDRIRIRLQEGDSATMTLRLESFDEGLSSWAGLLRAYEQWALLDEEGQIIEDVCDRLMRAQPHGLTTRNAAPSALFRRLVHEVAPRQRALLDELFHEFAAEDEEWLVPLRDFWDKTFDGALDLRFPGVMRPTRPTLRALDERYGREAAASRPPGPRTAPAGPRTGPPGPPGGRSRDGAAGPRPEPAVPHRRHNGSPHEPPAPPRPAGEPAGRYGDGEPYGAGEPYGTGGRYEGAEPYAHRGERWRDRAEPHGDRGEPYPGAGDRYPGAEPYPGAGAPGRGEPHAGSRAEPYTEGRQEPGAGWDAEPHGSREQISADRGGAPAGRAEPHAGSGHGPYPGRVEPFPGRTEPGSGSRGEPYPDREDRDREDRDGWDEPRRAGEPYRSADAYRPEEPYRAEEPYRDEGVARRAPEPDLKEEPWDSGDWDDPPPPDGRDHGDDRSRGDGPPRGGWDSRNDRDEETRL